MSWCSPAVFFLTMKSPNGGVVLEERTEVTGTTPICIGTSSSRRLTAWCIGGHNMTEYRHVRGHVEVYIDGVFVISADTMAEAHEEINAMEAKK